MKTAEKTQIEGVFIIDRKPATVNLTPGKTVYDERLFRISKVEYRQWNPRRSKLGAAIANKVKGIEFKKDDNVLYLGAASGTTISHVSDITKEGVVYGVEIAPRPLQDLVILSERRKNIIPILADANVPEKYAGIIEKCDIVFQDIAQKNQTEIFLKNLNMFLKEGGIGMLCVKARSVDVVKNPKEIFEAVEKELRKSLKIIDFKRLEPFERDHMFFVVKKQ